MTAERDAALQDRDEWERKWFAIGEQAHGIELERDAALIAMRENDGANEILFNAIQADRNLLRSECERLKQALGYVRSECLRSDEAIFLLSFIDLALTPHPASEAKDTLEVTHMTPQPGKPVIVDGPNPLASRAPEPKAPEALNETKGEPCPENENRNAQPAKAQAESKTAEGESVVTAAVEPARVAMEQVESNAPEAPAKHNPGNLTDAQVGVADGWRLLDEDEVIKVHGFHVLDDIEMRRGDEWCDQGHEGYNTRATYRTRLSRAELRNARGLEPETAEDIRVKRAEQDADEHHAIIEQLRSEAPAVPDGTPETETVGCETCGGTGVVISGNQNPHFVHKTVYDALQKRVEGLEQTLDAYEGDKLMLKDKLSTERTLRENAEARVKEVTEHGLSVHENDVATIAALESDLATLRQQSEARVREAEELADALAQEKKNVLFNLAILRTAYDQQGARVKRVEGELAKYKAARAHIGNAYGCACGPEWTQYGGNHHDPNCKDEVLGEFDGILEERQPAPDAGQQV